MARFMTSLSHQASIKFDALFSACGVGKHQVTGRTWAKDSVKVPCRAKTFQRESNVSILSPDGHRVAEEQRMG